MKKTYQTLLFLGVIFLSCSNNQKEGDSKKEVIGPSDSLIVLTESDDLNNPLYMGKLPTFENYHNREYITAKAFDTLKIDILKFDLLTVGAKKNHLDTLLVSSGDTLYIKLRQGKLLKSFANKKAEKWSYNTILKTSKTKQLVDSIFGSFFKKSVPSKEIPPLEVTNGKFKLLLPAPIDRFKDLSQYLVQNQIPVLVEKYELLIAEYKKHNRENMKNEKKAAFHNSLLINHIAAQLNFLYSKWKTPMIKDYLLLDLLTISQEQRPEIQYNFLNQQINLRYTDFNSKTPYLASQDLFRAYEAISKDIDSLWVEKARMICLERMIWDKGNWDSVNKYFNHFNKNYNNERFKEFIEETYLIEVKSFYNSPYNIDLIDIKNKATNWTTLKKSLSGKVIYVDYWASWCGPCRRAMPHARKLKAFYKNQDVAFVYLSIDEDKNKWISASHDEKIDEQDHSYLILNHNAANVENKLKIYAIPRYLLYNQKGELVDHDAPGPETEEIKSLINTLLH